MATCAWKSAPSSNQPATNYTLSSEPNSRKILRLIVTDENNQYEGIADNNTRHETVSHTQKEWVRGIVHTNGLEGVWSLFKRSIVGSYHQISVKHLDRYLDEFEFRFNNRENSFLFRDTLLRLLKFNEPRIQKPHSRGRRCRIENKDGLFSVAKTFIVYPKAVIGNSKSNSLVWIGDNNRDHFQNYEFPAMNLIRSYNRFRRRHSHVSNLRSKTGAKNIKLRNYLSRFLKKRVNH